MTDTAGRWVIDAGRPVVVKAGSSSLVRPTGELDPGGLEQAVDHVAGLWDSGHPTLLVSSGAVAAGVPALGLTGRPRDVPGLQAAAAVGQ
ncbi:MAG: glutamate 5-kinase, partial [Acidimicrobiia bacterium]